VGQGQWRPFFTPSEGYRSSILVSVRVSSNRKTKRKLLPSELLRKIRVNVSTNFCLKRISACPVLRRRDSSKLSSYVSTENQPNPVSMLRQAIGSQASYPSQRPSPSNPRPCRFLFFMKIHPSSCLTNPLGWSSIRLQEILQEHSSMP